MFLWLWLFFFLFFLYFLLCLLMFILLSIVLPIELPSVLRELVSEKVVPSHSILILLQLSVIVLFVFWCVTVDLTDLVPIVWLLLPVATHYIFHLSCFCEVFRHAVQQDFQQYWVHFLTESFYYCIDVIPMSGAFQTLQ